MGYKTRRSPGRFCRALQIAFSRLFGILPVSTQVSILSRSFPSRCNRKRIRLTIAPETAVRSSKEKNVTRYRIFPTLSLRILPRMPGPLPRRVPQSARACCFLRVIGLPQQGYGSASLLLPANTIFRGAYFRGCRHFFMFKPPSFCSPPRSFLPLRILPQGS